MGGKEDAMVPETTQMPTTQARQGRLHRPTVALVVLAITALLIPLLKRSKDHELSASDFGDVLLSQAQYPRNFAELQAVLPMLTLSAMALFHALAHDVAGVSRDNYKRWTAFTRYCESRAIMNAMAALNVWATQAQAVETAITNTGFQLETSNLISIALVVQHYLLTHPKIARNSMVYTLFTLLTWANVAAQCWNLAATSSTVDVLQAIFLTKAVWHAYMPQHFATSFEPWIELARRSSTPDQQRALAERFMEVAQPKPAGYLQVQTEDVAMDQV